MKKIAFAGASARGTMMYAEPFSKDFKDKVEIVGVYDVNPKRSQVLKNRTGLEFPVYTDFDEMMKSAKPDTVVVTTVDRFHHEYIIRSLEYGCDVITEKPMTIDEDKCNAILAAEKKTGKKVTVTFNYRYMPFATRIKELVKEGAIGTPLSVHFEWMLDTSHGADYFRRWHRQKQNSGGLMVHKATHHFDLVNWFLGERPVAVSAFGTLRYYGPNSEFHGERCHGCVHAGKCPFYWDMAAEPVFREFYMDCEDVDGYHRDQCVFDGSINIEDSMSVSVKYSGGTIMSYSLTAHSPYEGYRIVINGTEGRLEAEDIHTSIGVFAGQNINNLRLFNRRGEQMDIHTPKVTGDHGGGDTRLRRMLLDPTLPDPLGHAAGSLDGAYSIIVGIAANKSMKEGRIVQVDELLKI
jgi:predicted dehydrogenase